MRKKTRKSARLRLSKTTSQLRSLSKPIAANVRKSLMKTYSVVLVAEKKRKRTLMLKT